MKKLLLVFIIIFASCSVKDNNRSNCTESTESVSILSNIEFYKFPNNPECDSVLSIIEKDKQYYLIIENDYFNAKTNPYINSDRDVLFIDDYLITKKSQWIQKINNIEYRWYEISDNYDVKSWVLLKKLEIDDKFLYSKSEELTFHVTDGNHRYIIDKDKDYFKKTIIYLYVKNEVVIISFGNINFLNDHEEPIIEYQVEIDRNDIHNIIDLGEYKIFIYYANDNEIIAEVSFLTRFSREFDIINLHKTEIEFKSEELLKGFLGSYDINTLVKMNEIELIEDYIANGYSLELKEFTTGNSPVHNAIKNNNIEILKLLLTAGANINISNRDDSPLSLAIKLGLNEIAYFLIENGADINYASGNYRNIYPITRAIASNNIEMVEFLIKKKMSIKINGVESIFELEMSEEVFRLLESEYSVEYKRYLDYII